MPNTVASRSRYGPSTRRRHEPEVLLGEVAHHAQRAEGPADRLALVGGKHAVLGRTDAAVELERGGDVARSLAVVGGSAHAARVQQLAVVRGRGEFEQALVLGEERALVADEGFGGVEVDHEVVALHLAEIRIHGGGELHLTIRFPEHVDAGVAVAAFAHVVVQARNVGRDREQRLTVTRHFDWREVGQEARALQARLRPRDALARRADDAIEIDLRSCACRPWRHASARCTRESAPRPSSPPRPRRPRAASCRPSPC